ncbi:S8 family serine peptidase [Lacinutrix sp. 5H-3-7-4]|uniref:S8 family peptidase n=1 Tax=Lacinutrix sp. (strain 5H-3-7-4) TaxID=983544 RepID=UPI00020A35CE|nr:S8 family serine peptidase [Lacinutrix sp. 5H-3-7-4]AEH01314.1 peptidase S8 and S53 subtilisin kexin sedolisin [Lacinutrix sp. 5H-3-7-4]
MKTTPIKLLLVVLVIFSSCTKDTTIDIKEQEQQLLDQSKPLTIDEINARIEMQLNNGETFEWKNETDHFLWSAVVHGNNILTIGYGNENENFSENRSKELLDKKENILKTIEATENYTRSKETVVEHEIINVIDVKIENLESIIRLRKTNGIRYLEPNGYNHYGANNAMRSSSGCSKDGESINSAHYSTIAPNNAQVSWHFNEHNIPQAWNYSTGSGITIGLIDTGVSQSQSLLNGNGFKDGYSSNSRFVQKYGTFIDSNWWWSSNYDGPHDKCGHGTAMASTMAAPRNDNGMPVGVAYNSNLVAYRATEDVLLNDYHERKGVSKALTELANRSDVKIISMSIGYVWSIGNIKDAVKYAYSKGKLIFAAGGTSTSFTNGYGVIFPATMSETVAVTGVNDGSNYERCDTCHSGSKIDFTIIMEGDNNTSKAPPVLGFYNNQRRYTGGSSVATATTAGIAALVWSRHPSWSRAQVLNKLKQSSEFYPNKNSSFGYGNINALQAVQ